MTTSALSQKPWTAPARKARLSEVHYSPRVGGVIGARGELVEWRLSPDSTAARIASLQVGCAPPSQGRLVQCVRVVYGAPFGKTDTLLIGGAAGAEWFAPHVLSPGQTLVGISGAGGWFVDALQFHFSDGASTPRYGGTGGDTGFAVRLHTQPDGAARSLLLGLYGSETQGRLESIGLVFWPLL